MTTPLLQATVSLDAIAHNLGVLKEASGAEIMAVVKADAYGHGAVAVANTVIASGARELGTATLAEALDLRAAGVAAPVTCWLLSTDLDFESAITMNVGLGVSSSRILDAVISAARRTGHQARVTVKVDTGLGRGGVASDDWERIRDLIAKSVAEESINLVGLMSHLARGDEPEHPLNDEQAQVLDRCAAELKAVGVDPGRLHLSNSPAALTRPDLSRDMVRPGIALYGRSPIPERGDFGLIPAMTLTAQVFLVKNISAGQGVSYNHTWVAPYDTVIGVIAAGYADGVPRALSGRLQVMINGRNFPAVGRVAMDQTVIDLGPDGGGVGEGDHAVLFGTGAHGEPTASDWARAVGTIDYEILTGIRGRRVRRYLGGPADTQGN